MSDVSRDDLPTSGSSTTSVLEPTHVQVSVVVQKVKKKKKKKDKLCKHLARVHTCDTLITFTGQICCTVCVLCTLTAKVTDRPILWETDKSRFVRVCFFFYPEIKSTNCFHFGHFILPSFFFFYDRNENIFYFICTLYIGKNLDLDSSSR